MNGHDALGDVRPVKELSAPPYNFSEFDRDDQVGHDQLDDAVVALVEIEGSAVSAVWRTWRYPEPGATVDGPGTDEPVAPHRVYLIEADDEAAIGPLTAGLLVAVGDPANAGIEVVGPDGELSPYQQAALDASMLVWAATDEPEFTVARAYDYADPKTGPHFRPGHRVIADMIERERLLTYLRGGHPVLTTMSSTTDILDPSAGSVVPGSFLTDGEWIWTDTVTYYLERHGMAPDVELIAHIERQFAAGAVVPRTDRETAIRAGHFLLDPPAKAKKTPVWRPGTRSV
jgi:hypothetical protein